MGRGARHWCDGAGEKGGAMSTCKSQRESNTEMRAQPPATCHVQRHNGNRVLSPQLPQNSPRLAQGILRIAANAVNCFMFICDSRVRQCGPSASPAQPVARTPGEGGHTRPSPAGQRPCPPEHRRAGGGHQRRTRLYPHRLLCPAIVYPSPV